MKVRRLRWPLAVVVVATVAAGCASQSRGNRDSGLTPIGAGVSGPSGLQATVYAQGLTNASAFALDDERRLWVATAALSDEGTDGVYFVSSPGEAPVEVISGLHTPLGLLWQGESLYVAQRGEVDVYSGFDGTGFNSNRTLVQFPAGTGELNGLAMLPTGRIALGISAPCDHCTPTQSSSASVVSFLPDGSDLKVEASGIRAPVGLTVAPTGDLLVTMNQRDDLGEATPGDWLGVVQSGQDWGFPDCYGQGGTACDGVPQPAAVLDPHAAVAGVAVASPSLAGGTDTVVLVAEWNTGRVLKVDLHTDESGATTSTVQPFLLGLQRPEPLLTTPSGSLLVGDWASGTVYEVTATSPASAG